MLLTTPPAIHPASKLTGILANFYQTPGIASSIRLDSTIAQTPLLIQIVPAQVKKKEESPLEKQTV